jgi:hypothetical protein
MVTGSELGEFVLGLQNRLDLFQGARRELNLYLANEFNVLRCFDPDENAISRILAILLDPKVEYGKPRSFLDEFLKTIGHPERCADSGNVRSATTLGGEQKDHVPRYLKHLCMKYKGCLCLVFVDVRGRPPDSIPSNERGALEEDGKFRMISYHKELKSWVDVCARTSDATRSGGFSAVLCLTSRGGSHLWRAKVTTEEQNLVVRSASETSEQSWDLLLSGLRSKSKQTRRLAANAARMQPRPTYLMPLLDALRVSREDGEAFSVIYHAGWEALAAIAAIRDGSAVPELVRLLQSGEIDTQLRGQLAAVIASIGGGGIARALMKELDSHSTWIGQQENVFTFRG